MSETGTTPRRAESARSLVRESFVTGLAVVVPLLVTLLVLSFVFSSVYRYLSLVTGYVPLSFTIVIVPGVVVVGARTLLELLVPVLFLVATCWIGLVVNRWRYGERAVDYFDYVITRVPGVGSIYESFRQMSDVVLEGDEESFREVKLVEFPHEDSYTLGFVTTETPEPLATPTAHDELVTMFLPMAPNPVMGGHLVHLPTERVMDVDLTVEEGIQTIVTSGVALADEGSASLSPNALRELASAEQADQRFDPRAESPYIGGRDRFVDERATRYDENVDPQFADRPVDIVDRTRGAERADAGSDAVGGDRPARRAGREPEARESTDGRPAEQADRPADARESTDGRPAERSDGDGGETDDGQRTDADGRKTDGEPASRAEAEGGSRDGGAGSWP